MIDPSTRTSYEEHNRRLLFLASLPLPVLMRLYVYRDPVPTHGLDAEQARKEEAARREWQAWASAERAE